MKKISIPFLTVTCSLVLFTSCKKGESSSEQTSNPSKPPVGAMQSAEKNSFQEVASHLDPGGNLYLYFSTEQMLDGLSAKASNLHQLLGALPNVKEGDRENLEKGVNIITNLIVSSGIEDVSG